MEQLKSLSRNPVGSRHLLPRTTRLQTNGSRCISTTCGRNQNPRRPRCPTQSSPTEARSRNASVESIRAATANGTYEPVLRERHLLRTESVRRKASALGNLGRSAGGSCEFGKGPNGARRSIKKPQLTRYCGSNPSSEECVVDVERIGNGSAGRTSSGRTRQVRIANRASFVVSFLKALHIAHL